MYNIKIYLINLPRHKERLYSFTTNCSYDYELVKAIDGEHFVNTTLFQNWPYLFPSLSVDTQYTPIILTSHTATKALQFSNHMIFSSAKELNNIEWIVICEDDAILPKNINFEVQNIFNSLKTEEIE
jgi:hypothetical protein